MLSRLRELATTELVAAGGIGSTKVKLTGETAAARVARSLCKHVRAAVSKTRGTGIGSVGGLTTSRKHGWSLEEGVGAEGLGLLTAAEWCLLSTTKLLSLLASSEHRIGVSTKYATR